jgi:hydroxypyruvate reductase
LRACDPRRLLFRAFDAHPLPSMTTFNVVAAGKAARPMSDAFVERFGARTREVVIAHGGHPLPDEQSFASGEAALRLADANRARGETLVVLLSGGASAMMAAPAPGVTLEDKIAMTRELLRSGLPIAEMNTRRKRLSAIKGGRLAVRAGRSITFAISDVHAPVEDDPSVIGSGPTVITDPSIGRADTTFVLVGSRRDAMDGASAEAVRLGYEVQRIDSPTLGEARESARIFATRITGAVAARHDSDGARQRLSVIASGETTVTLSRDSTGRGGRNQEFALAAALALEDAPATGTPAVARGGPSLAAAPEGWALACVGTDGIDGPTDAAGAIVDSTTLSRAVAAGLDPPVALALHDSYPLFERLGDLVITGPTNTNVGDLQVLVCQSRVAE